MAKVAKRLQKLWKALKSCQSCQKMAKVAKRCKSMTKVATSSQKVVIDGLDNMMTWWRDDMVLDPWSWSHAFCLMYTGLNAPNFETTTGPLTHGQWKSLEMLAHLKIYKDNLRCKAALRSCISETKIPVSVSLWLPSMIMITITIYWGWWWPLFPCAPSALSSLLKLLPLKDLRIAI